MHVVRGFYHRSPARAGRYVQYISHREEGLPRGERREIYGIGERYKEVARMVPDPLDRERAYKRLIEEDAQRLRRPVFHQRVFTVDNRAAAQLASLARAEAERELRDAFAKALRGTAVGRQVQGVYAIHWHGGEGRPAHPHIHALLSPLRRDSHGLYLAKSDLLALQGAWIREVERKLSRGLTPLRAHTPGRAGPPRLDVWVTGTTIAQALRQAPLLLRQVERAPLTTLGSQVGRHTPGLGEAFRAATIAAALARDPIQTLARLAVATALRPLPLPVTAITRALYGLSRTLRPEP
jgi:hypothetical protein